MLIKSPSLTRFPNFIGYAQRRALQMLVKLGPNEEPPADALTSRGVLRKHTLNDLTMSGLATSKVNARTGTVIFLPTAKGRKALAEARTQKKPQVGWRKVRRTNQRRAA